MFTLTVCVVGNNWCPFKFDMLSYSYWVAAGDDSSHQIGVHRSVGRSRETGRHRRSPGQPRCVRSRSETLVVTMWHTLLISGHFHLQKSLLKINICCDERQNANPHDRRSLNNAAKSASSFDGSVTIRPANRSQLTLRPASARQICAA